MLGVDGENPRAPDIAALLDLLLEHLAAVDSGDPLRALHALSVRQLAIDEWLCDAVAQARLQGLTWSAIGAALGMSRQGAWDRFSARGSGATCDPRLPGA